MGHQNFTVQSGLTQVGVLPDGSTYIPGGVFQTVVKTSFDVTYGQKYKIYSTNDWAQSLKLLCQVEANVDSNDGRGYIGTTQISEVIVSRSGGDLSIMSFGSATSSPASRPFVSFLADFDNQPNGAFNVYVTPVSSNIQQSVSVSTLGYEIQA